MNHQNSWKRKQINKKFINNPFGPKYQMLQKCYKFHTNSSRKLERQKQFAIDLFQKANMALTLRLENTLQKGKL